MLPFVAVGAPSRQLTNFMVHDLYELSIVVCNGTLLCPRGAVPARGDIITCHYCMKRNHMRPCGVV
jgi:hypothetical protein